MGTGVWLVLILTLISLIAIGVENRRVP